MKQFLLALTGLFLIACGSQAKFTPVQKGATLTADQNLTCKGSVFQGNEWYSKGKVWSEVEFVDFSKPTKIERSGMNYCRNDSGNAVTLTVKENEGGKTRSFTTSADHFYFEITSGGKVVGTDITEIVNTYVLGKFDVAVTTTSTNEMFVQSATLDGKEILFLNGRVFNVTQGLILTGLTPGVLILRVCFNEVDTVTCNNVVIGGKMDPRNAVYLKVVKTNFDSFKIDSYIEDANKEQSLIVELMADGSFSSPSVSTPNRIAVISFNNTVICVTNCNDVVVDLNIVDGLYGTHAKGKNILHTGAVWTDIGDWGQSQFSLWCRMQQGGSCGYTPSAINDSTRSAGTWDHMTLPGIFGDSADDRQFRRSISITSGKRYSIKYCGKSASSGPMYLDVVSTDNAGDHLQVSIYDLTVTANVLYCDSFTFDSSHTGTFYLAGHIASIPAGDIRFDDLSLTEVP